MLNFDRILISENIFSNNLLLLLFFELLKNKLFMTFMPKFLDAVASKVFPTVGFPYSLTVFFKKLIFHLSQKTKA